MLPPGVPCQYTVKNRNRGVDGASYGSAPSFGRRFSSSLSEAITSALAWLIVTLLTWRSAATTVTAQMEARRTTAVFIWMLRYKGDRPGGRRIATFPH